MNKKFGAFPKLLLVLSFLISELTNAGLSGTYFNFGYAPVSTSALECRIILAPDIEGIKTAILEHYGDFTSGRSTGYFSPSNIPGVKDHDFFARLLNMQNTALGQNELNLLLEGEASSHIDERVEVGPGDQPVCKNCLFLEKLTHFSFPSSIKHRRIFGEIERLSDYFPPTVLTLVVMKNFGWIQDNAEEIRPILQQIQSRLIAGGKLLIIDDSGIYRHYEVHGRVGADNGFLVQTIKGWIRSEPVAGLLLTKK